jgi:hypothetical protein
MMAELDGENDTILHYHCRSNAHRSLVLQIAAMKSSKLRSWCAKQQLRMEQFRGENLALEQWQSLVRCQLYWLLLNYRAWTAYGFDKFEITGDVEKTLDTYEWKERLVLLDLMLWRAVCQSTDSYHSWRDGTNQGWKQRKAEMRGSSNIDIILRAVLPFLGDEPEESDNDDNDDDEDPDFSHDDDEDSDSSDDDDGDSDFTYADSSSHDSDDEDESYDSPYDDDAECFLDDQLQEPIPFRAYRYTDRTWNTELTTKNDILQLSIVCHTRIGRHARCKETFQCELCHVEMTLHKEIVSHCHTGFHKGHIRQVLAMKRCPATAWCASIQCRLELFGARGTMPRAWALQLHGFN